MQPYFWVCAECGLTTDDPVDSCPKCRNRIWGKVMRVQKPAAQERAIDPGQDSTQRGGENLAPYLKLVSELINSIECGACNAIIYKPQGKFDEDILTACKRKHYAESPSCKPS